MELKSILVLLIILSIILYLTYFITNKRKKSSRVIATKQEPRFDVLMRSAESSLGSSDEYDDYHEEDFDHASNNMLLDDPILRPKSTQQKLSDLPEKKKPSLDEVIFLIVAAKPDKPYVGYELLQSLLTSGLRFGAMEIFHRHEDLNGKGKILFSVASASEPGTFEINKMGAYSGKALMMFLRLSSNKDLMAAFETMLDTAKQLVEDLGGEVLDQDRKALSLERIDKMRQQILDFDQKQRIGDLFDE